MRSHPRHLRLSAAATLAVAVLIGSALPASAGVPDPCSFAGGTLTITLPSGADGTLGRSGTAITLNGQPCGGATVSTTDSISITIDTGTSITIDLSAGPFAPGATDEQDGSSEIEIDVATADQGAKLLSVTGSPFADFLAADDLTGTLTLNTDEEVPDVDVTMEAAFDLFEIDGAGGADYIDIAHTYGHVLGGEGNDIIGSIDNEEAQIDGEGGGDQVTFAGSTAPIQLLGDESTMIVGDPGGPYQQLSSIRAVRATSLDDQLTIGGNLNVLGVGGDDTVNVAEGDHVVIGGTGDDVLGFPQTSAAIVRVDDGVGRSEGTVVRFSLMETIVGSNAPDRFVPGTRDQVLDGGGGLDTYWAAHVPHSIVVRLRSGAVSNGDHLAHIESVIGSPFADILGGSRLGNLLAGQGGPDKLVGLGGADTLFGGDGPDRLDGGAGTDECHGGAQVDVLVSC